MCKGAVQVSCILTSLFFPVLFGVAVKKGEEQPPKRAAHRNTQNALFVFLVFSHIELYGEKNKFAISTTNMEAIRLQCSPARVSNTPHVSYVIRA